MRENTIVEDTLSIAFNRARALADGVGLIGYGVAVVRGEDGQVKQAIPFSNIVTTAGDEYYVRKAITGIGPANASAPTAVNGMKLGTGTAEPTKSGSAAALGTYISGSNVAFDATYPTVSAVGTDTGWQATYRATWAAGVATNAAISEVAIVRDQATNATSTAANTISRALIGPYNKTSTDSLEITWNHKLLGA